jgi:purine-binding chemotaxis protein CheW
MAVTEARMNESANSMTNARTEPMEVCVVRAGALFAGVPIAYIAEIVGAVRPQPLPHAPWFVGGLVLYRGEVLTAVDLGRLLDLRRLREVESESSGPGQAGFERPGFERPGLERPGLERPGRPCSMLVVDCGDGRSAGGAFGLLVDRVDEVLAVSSEDYEPNPSILDPRHRELFDGAYRLEGRLLVMLKAERLDPSYLGPAYLAASLQKGSGESMPARQAEGER